MSGVAPHPHVIVIGAGPAGLMAADLLSGSGVKVTVFERMLSAGRKFLLAGRGGLNLTHSEELERFLARYGVAEPHLRAAIEAFPPDAVRAWSAGLGQTTFIGSSGRVFPVGFKTSPLLRAWLRRLADAGVEFQMQHRWTGWDARGAALFAAPDGSVAIKADAMLLALGGASWPKLGSDGGWADVLRHESLTVAPLLPANCGFTTSWSEVFAARFAGQPLKRIELSFAGQTVRGDAIVTKAGLEGGAIYALSAPLRDAILASGEVMLQLALRPDLTLDELKRRLDVPRPKQSLSNILRKAANLSPVAIGLLHEGAMASSERLSAMPGAAIAERINAVSIRLTGITPISRAISTAGGLTFDELDDDFMLRRRAGVFAAGEMLDWEAPTGGYLLQASLATGAAAGRGILRWLAHRA